MKEMIIIAWHGDVTHLRQSAVCMSLSFFQTKDKCNLNLATTMPSSPTKQTLVYRISGRVSRAAMKWLPEIWPRDTSYFSLLCKDLSLPGLPKGSSSVYKNYVSTCCQTEDVAGHSTAGVLLCVSTSQLHHLSSWNYKCASSEHDQPPFHLPTCNLCNYMSIRFLLFGWVPCWNNSKLSWT